MVIVIGKLLTLPSFVNKGGKNQERKRLVLHTAFVIMATSIKVSRPARLTEDETLTSFEDWKNNVIFYLSQDTGFELFLKSSTSWKKKNDTTAHRGLETAAICQKLGQSLGV